MLHDGDVVEYPNGNRYVVVHTKQNRYLAYIGNKDRDRSDVSGFMNTGSAGELRAVGRVIMGV